MQPEYRLHIAEEMNAASSVQLGCRSKRNATSLLWMHFVQIYSSVRPTFLLEREKWPGQGLGGHGGSRVMWTL